LSHRREQIAIAHRRELIAIRATVQHAIAVASSRGQRT
jgi:hypothetical protein